MLIYIFPSCLQVNFFHLMSTANITEQSSPNNLSSEYSTSNSVTDLTRLWMEQRYQTVPSARYRSQLTPSTQRFNMPVKVTWEETKEQTRQLSEPSDNRAAQHMQQGCKAVQKHMSISP